MTAAFEQRLETENLWQHFAGLVVDETFSIAGGIPWPWFDGSNVWVSDKALILRFTMCNAPVGDVLLPYKYGLWKCPQGMSAQRDLLMWNPPVEHIGLISPEPCRKDMPVSVAGKPLNCDRLWKRLVPCDCDQGGDICGLCIGMREYLERIDEASEPHRVFNRTFGRRYLWIVSQLPGLKIEVRRGAMQLQFEGGRGVLMGMET